jgi:hypothetical protein
VTRESGSSRYLQRDGEVEHCEDCEQEEIYRKGVHIEEIAHTHK